MDVQLGACASGDCAARNAKHYSAHEIKKRTNRTSADYKVAILRASLLIPPSKCLRLQFLPSEDYSVKSLDWQRG